MNCAEPQLKETSTLREALISYSFWFQLAALGILISLLYYYILARLVTEWWTDPNFSHGFLVPLFSACVVWKNRKQLEDLPKEPSWFGENFAGMDFISPTTGFVLTNDATSTRTLYKTVDGGATWSILGK